MKTQTMKKQNFNDWMINKIQSIHYANHTAMINAFERFRNTDLKRHNYRFNQ